MIHIPVGAWDRTDVLSFSLENECGEITEYERGNLIQVDRIDNIFHHDEKITFLKMDIEGAELSALDGAKELIKGDKPLKVAVCAYHKEKDEDEIKKRLTNFQITTSTGWMFASYNYPYFRRGIIRAKKMINESI